MRRISTIAVPLPPRAWPSEHANGAADNSRLRESAARWRHCRARGTAPSRSRWPSVAALGNGHPRHVLIDDLPLAAHFDPGLADASVVRADVALFVGPGGEAIVVGYGNAVVGIDAGGGLPGGALACRIGLEQGGEVTLDRRLAVDPEGRPERGDGGVVGE